MPVYVSKVRTGVLIFTPTVGDAVDFSCQVTSAMITPSDEGTSASDAEYVLCGDKIPDDTGAASDNPDTLDFETVSDHNIAQLTVAFSWEHRGEVVQWRFVPNTAPDEGGGAQAQDWEGTCIVKAMQMGGQVEERISVSSSWDILSLNPPAGFGDGYGASKAYASPGTVFPAEATITAEDEANAAKLDGLGYVAYPQSAWLTGQSITIGTFKFYWDGAEWQPGTVARNVKKAEDK